MAKTSAIQRNLKRERMVKNLDGIREMHGLPHFPHNT